MTFTEPPITPDEFTCENGKVSWSYTENMDLTDFNVYTAIYDEAGRLAYVKSNAPKGSAELPVGKYSAAIYIWDDDYVPLCGKIEFN